MLSDIKEYIIGLLEKDFRLDERKLNEFREIKIETGISKNAEGSAKVTIGETEVAVGVKMDIGEPFPDTQDEGILIVSAELLPISNPDFEAGPPDAQATELARIVDRGVRESKCIDIKKLCLKEGEKVWMIFIDIYSVNDNGNLVDAAALAALAALRDAKIPQYDKETFKVKYGELTKEKLPLIDLPIACTIFKIGNKMLVDAGLDEEKVSDMRLTITTTKKGNIHAMQKGGIGSLSIEELENAVELAIVKGKELRKLLE